MFFPCQWLAALDPSTQRIYFTDVKSGQTTWEQPADYTAWIRKFDPSSGRHFYQNPVENLTQWEDPNAPWTDIETGEKGGVATSAEWFRRFDPSSQKYFYENHSKSLTQWEEPSEPWQDTAADAAPARAQAQITHQGVA